MTDQPTSTLPHACGRCGNRWAGSRTAHCGSCHLTFGSPTSFDDHRIRRGPNEGTCADPATAGLVSQDRAGYVVWTAPSDDDAFARLREAAA